MSGSRLCWDFTGEDKQMSNKRLDPAYLRQQIADVNSTFETPFGERLMT